MIELLTNTEEKNLIKSYQQSKDSKLISQLIAAHQGYISKVCNKVYKSFRGDVAFEDLFQSATLGFIHGINNFDLNYKNRLTTYTHFWMMDELFKLYQQTLPVHVPAHTLRKLCWRTGNQRSEELNEIHEKIAKPLQLQRIYDDSNSDDVFLKRKAFDADVDSTAEYFDKYLLPEDVQFIINKLPDNVKRAFWMRTGLDMGGRYTIEEIAEELNVPQKIAQNFINKAVKYLRKEPVIQKIKKKEAFN